MSKLVYKLEIEQGGKGEHPFLVTVEHTVAGVKQADYLTGKTLRAALNKLTAYITEREFLENDHRVMEIERKRLTGAVKAVEYGER